MGQIVSLKEIKDEVKCFVKSPVPEVMAIKGNWGVGKTYAWLQFLKEFKGDITLKKYSYVSLFGLQSIEELRLAIFANTIPVRSIGSNKAAEYIKKNYKDPKKVINDIKGIKGASKSYFISSEFLFDIFGLFKQVLLGLFDLVSIIRYVKALFPLLESTSKFLSKEMIICLDDLERKSSRLQYREIMGLINDLKEIKKCKIVLILNDDELTHDEDKNDYKKIREKVIDVELMFEPTAKECLEIALSEKNDSNTIIKKYIEQLNINNIRIINKIKALTFKLADAADWGEYDISLYEECVKSLVLFTYSFYVKDGHVPEIEFIQSKGSVFFVQSEISEDDKSKVDYLREYEFSNFDELDAEILHLVKKGYLSQESITKILNEKNKIIGKHNKQAAIREIWDIYRNTFNMEVDRFVDIVLEKCSSHITSLSPESLNQIVMVLRDIDASQVADELLGLYKQAFSDKQHFMIENIHFGAVDEGLKDAFSSKLEELKEKRLFNDIIQDLLDDKEISKEDAEVLSESSVNEYISLFKSFNDSRLPRILKIFLKKELFGFVENDCLVKIGQKTRNALSEIGKENKLNAIKVAPLLDSSSTKK